MMEEISSPGSELEAHIQQYHYGVSTELNKYLGILKNPETQPSTLTHCLSELEHCVLHLNENLKFLITSALHVKWAGRDPDLAMQYTKFVLELVVPHSSYIQPVLYICVRLFIPVPAENVHKEVEHNVVVQEQTFRDVHKLIQMLVKVIPMAPSILIKVISHCYPFRSRSTQAHLCYVENILHICTYVPSLRCQILEMIFTKVMEFDTMLSRDDISKIRKLEEVSADEIFDMEGVKSGVGKEASKAEVVYDKLDNLMYVLFNFVQNCCNPNDAFDWKETQVLYREILSSFERVVLPTDSSGHIQFLIFYLCSFRQALSDAFLDFLWKRFQALNASVVLKQNCLAYLGGFVARAKFVPVSSAKTLLKLLCAWLNEYINTVDSQCGRPSQQHDVFYAACQAALYIFVFRHGDLSNMKGGISFLQSLNFQRIVTCELNPLRVCHPLVTHDFASLTRALQIAYCYTVIEHNNRNASSVATKATLGLFFPYDPYLLRKSSSYVTPLYREYKFIQQLEQAHSADDDYDDDFLQYGESPGFKHSPFLLGSPPAENFPMMSL